MASNTTTPHTGRVLLGASMYTTLVVDENQPGWYFDFVRSALERSTDKRQVELSPKVFAEHSPDGLAIKFSTRILRTPDGFKGAHIVRVIIEHTFNDESMSEFFNKKVVRRRAWATVSRGVLKEYAFLTVWGNNLGSANNLYQGILDGIVQDWQ